jgi:hypothetical protein
MKYIYDNTTRTYLKKHKKVRTLAEAYADPRVESFSDERGDCPDGGDGIWLYLRRPYFNPSCEVSCVHEWNVKDLLRALNEDVREDEAAWLDIAT